MAKHTFIAINGDCRYWRIIEDGVQKVYFFYSFAFLIFRTVAVSLYAAWINDESKVPAGILNSIPSSMYDCEVSIRDTNEKIYIAFIQKYCRSAAFYFK